MSNPNDAMRNQILRGIANLALGVDGFYKIAFVLATTGVLAGFTPAALAAVAATGVASLFVSIEPIKDALKKWAEQKGPEKFSHEQVEQLAAQMRASLQEAGLLNEDKLIEALGASYEAATINDLSLIETDLNRWKEDLIKIDERYINHIDLKKRGIDS